MNATCNADNPVRYYHYDITGSTVALSNAQGELITKREGSTDTRFLFCGAYGVQTDASGLVHMRARYYHPYLCRFLSEDPIGFEGGMNWFAYADGDPLMMSDPSGLYAGVDDAIAGGIGAAVGLAIQGSMDLWHWQRSPGSHYLAAAAGGAVAGVGTLYLGPGGVGLGTATAAGIAGVGGAATSNVIRQTADISTGRQESFSGSSLAMESAFGGAGGAIGSKVAPYILRPLSNQVKGMIGEGTSLVYNLAKGNIPVGRQFSTGTYSGRTPVWDWEFQNVFSGASTIVESKFGTSGLTAAQRAGAPFVSNLRVEKWTYGFWSGAGGAFGGIAGGTAYRK
jgi:RHS repeat-associated protein